MVRRTVIVDVRTTNTRRLDSLDNQLSRVDRNARNTTQSIGRLSGVASAVITALSLQRLATYADGWTNLDNRIRQVTSSQEELESSTQRIFQIAQSSRTALDAVGTLYFRISQAAEEIGVSGEQAFVITESLANSLTASGLSAAETASVLRQTSQAFNAGRLNGDEFRAISEAIPSVLRLVSEELGVSRRELQRYSEAGRITSQVLANALIRNIEESRRVIGDSTVTISQSVQLLENSTIRFIGTFNETFPVVQGIVDVFNDMSDALDFVNDGIDDTNEFFGRFERNGEGVLALYTRLVEAGDDFGEQLLESITESDLFIGTTRTLNTTLELTAGIFERVTNAIVEYGIGLRLLPEPPDPQVPQREGDGTVDVDPLTDQQRRFVEALRNRLDQENELLRGASQFQILIQERAITEQEAQVRQATTRRLQIIDNASRRAIATIGEAQFEQLGLEESFIEQRRLVVEQSEEEIAQIRQEFRRRNVDEVREGLDQELQLLMQDAELRRQIEAGQISQQEASEIQRRDARLLRLQENQAAVIESISLAQAQELGLLELFEQNKEAIVIASEQRILQARQAFQRQNVQTVLGAFGQLQQLNQRSLGLQRVSIVANTASAVIQSYNNAGGYPLGIIPATIMAAIGARQLAQVGRSSLSGGGASGGGGASSAASPGITTPTLSSTPFVTTESTLANDILNELRNRDEGELYTTREVRRLLASFADAQSLGVA